MNIHLSRDYGPITLEYTTDTEAKTAAEVQRVSALFLAGVMLALEDFERDNMTRLGTGPRRKSDPATYEHYAFQVTEVEYGETKTGKRVLRVKGGRYAKFGAPAYEELLDKTTAVIPAGTGPVSSTLWALTEIRDNGKPVVIALSNTPFPANGTGGE